MKSIKTLFNTVGWIVFFFTKSILSEIDELIGNLKLLKLVLITESLLKDSSITPELASVNKQFISSVISKT